MMDHEEWVVEIFLTQVIVDDTSESVIETNVIHHSEKGFTDESAARTLYTVLQRYFSPSNSSD